MALSGTVYKDFYNPGDGARFRFQIVWSATQNTANNTSTISTTAQLVGLRSTSKIISGNQRAVTINIDGSGYSGTHTLDITGTTTINLFTASKTVYHNSSGAKSFTLGGSLAVEITFNGTYISSVSIPNTTQTLNTIPRASSFTAFGSFTIGNAFSLSVARQDSSFTDTLTLKAGSTVIQTWTSQVNPTSLTPSASAITALYTASKSANSITVTLVCQTYSGTTPIGSATSRTATATVSSSLLPSLSGITATEANTSVGSLLGGNNFAQNLSTIKFTVTGGAPSTGATISSYSISFNGWTWTGTTTPPTPTTPIIDRTGNLTATVTLTDSRARTASKSVIVTMIAYSPPVLSSSNARRANSSGSPIADGTSIRVDRAGSISALSVGGVQKNNYTVKIETKPRTSGSWTQASSDPFSNTSYTGFKTLAGPFSTATSFDIRITVTDKFKSVTAIHSIGTASYPFVLGPNSVGIGKVPERGVLDVGGDAYVSGMLYPDNQFISRGFTTSGTPNAVGWKRLCTFKASDYNSADGVGGLVANIKITRYYNNANNEAMNITLAQTYQIATFTVNAMYQNYTAYTAIRLMTDSAGNEAHIDVFYNLAVANTSHAYITFDTPSNLTVTPKGFANATTSGTMLNRGQLEIKDGISQILTSTSGGDAKCHRSPDGWQTIAWRRNLSTTINLASGGMFYSANSIPATAWPWPFSEAPAVTVQSYGNGQYTWCGMPWSPSATTCPAIALYKGSADGTTRGYGVDITAHGRWK